MKYDNEGWDVDAPMAAEPEADPRVVAVQRVVDLEREHNWAQRDADERQKKAAIIGEQLSQARDEMAGLLGYPSKSGMKSMSPDMGIADRATR